MRGHPEIQERNPHDYMDDFDTTLTMYQHVRTVVDLAMEIASADESLVGNLYRIYQSLETMGIVGKDEPETLEAWFSDLH